MIISKHIGDQVYQFEVSKRRHQKRIIVRPKTAGLYTVTAPKHCRRSTIENMIDAHRDTILKMSPLYDLNVDYQVGQTITIFNEPVKIVQESGKPAIRKEGNRLIVFGVDADRDAVKKRITAYLQTVFEEALEALVLKYRYAVQGTDLKQLSFRVKQLKSKFGSCQPKALKVTMNLELIHYPKNFLTFIFLHEISHLVHQNHSKAFYQFFATLYPDYKHARVQLNYLRSRLYKDGFKGLIQALDA